MTMDIVVLLPTTIVAELEAGKTFTIITVPMATAIYYRNQPTVLVFYDLLLRRELFANIVLDDEEEEAGIINTHGMHAYTSNLTSSSLY